MSKNPFKKEREKNKRNNKILSIEEYVGKKLEAGSRATISRLENDQYPKSFYILKRYRQNGASLDKIFDSINIAHL